MFKNIGKKIMTLAKVNFWVGAVLCALGGFGTVMEAVDSLYGSTEDAVAGFIIMLLGPLLSWIGSLLLYGFGQLIDNTGFIAYAQQVQMQKTQSENKG